MIQTIKKYFAGLSKNTYLLAFASLFSDISTEMLYPILPVFLTQLLNANGSIVGLIEGIAQATQNIVQGFSGWLADRLKKRKGIALLGYFFAALAKPMMGIAASWHGVLNGRFLDRLGTGIRSAPRDALVAASVSPIDRGKAFGLEGFGDNLGAFLGPLLALFFLSFLQFKIRSIFYLAIIPGVLAFLMILFVKEKPITVPIESKLNTKPWLFPKIYWKFLFAIALFGFGNSSNAFLILQTQNLGIPLKTTILIYAGYNLMAAFISYPAGFLSDVLGRKNILLISFMIFIIVYLGFALTHQLVIIAILFILYGLHQGIFRSVGKAMATDFVPEEFHASGIGWYSMTLGLLQLIASIIAGLLWDYISPQSVFIWGASFALLGSIALFSLIPTKQIHTINGG